MAQSLPMLSVTVTIADLFEFEGKLPPAERPDDAAIGDMIQRQFRFLPQPINVQIGKKDATISFNEESHAAKEEAGRLAAKASERASAGNYSKAISAWKRALELRRVGAVGSSRMLGRFLLWKSSLLASSPRPS